MLYCSALREKMNPINWQELDGLRMYNFEVCHKTQKEKKKHMYFLIGKSQPIGYIDINIINCICEYSLMFRKEILKAQ